MNVEQDPEEIDRILRAGQSLTAVDGVVSRAVVVLEIHQPDGAVTFDLLATSALPWDNLGLLDYGRAQVLLSSAED